MKERIDNFFSNILEKPIELYSEFGFQHELAIFLRNNYNDIKVKLEYPTTKIFDENTKLIKKEIDIYIETKAGKRYVIELKMPKIDCGTPNEMYKAIQDVIFLEQLRQKKIDGCYAILITERQAFWQSKESNVGIYKLFNGEKIHLKSVEQKQLPNFLHSRGSLTLTKSYHANWKNYTDINFNKWKYYFLEV